MMAIRPQIVQALVLYTSNNGRFSMLEVDPIDSTAIDVPYEAIGIVRQAFKFAVTD